MTTGHGCVPPVVGVRPKHVRGLQRKSWRSRRPVSPLGPARSAAGGHHDHERWGPCCPRASECCDQPHLGSSSPSRAIPWATPVSAVPAGSSSSLCLSVSGTKTGTSSVCVFCVARATATTCELVTVNRESTVHEPLHRFHLHLRTRCLNTVKIFFFFFLSFVFWLQKRVKL